MLISIEPQKRRENQKTNKIQLNEENNRPAKKNFNIRKPKNNKIYEEEKSDLLKKYQKQKKNK
jgi:hypothetical protein